MRYTFSFISLFISFVVYTQVNFKLSNASSIVFKNKVFVFGITTTDSKSELKLYKLSSQIKLQDSITQKIGLQAKDYLNLNCDTLHGFLNIYLQQINKKQIAIYRFNDSLKLLSVIENVDIARVNFVNDLNRNLFYYKNKVYSVFSRQDSGGNQFYINSYKLKSTAKNFEYEQEWQFPFERKNIFSAKIIAVKYNRLYVFVTINGGKNHGKWLIYVNEASGKLQHAARVSDKTNFSRYEYGTFLIDTTTQNVILLGQKFAEKEFSSSTNNISISTNTLCNIYHVVVDSAGNLLDNSEIKCPIVDIKTGTKKVNNFYVIKPYDLKLNENGNYNFKLDLYKSENQNKCFRYCNSFVLNTENMSGILKLEKAIVKTNLDIEKFYFTSDDADNNGKLCYDSLLNFESAYVISEISKVKFAFNYEDNTPFWILKKFDSQTNNYKFSTLKSNGKIFVLSKAIDIPVNTGTTFFYLNKKTITAYYKDDLYKLSVEDL